MRCQLPKRGWQLLHWLAAACWPASRPKPDLSAPVPAAAAHFFLLPPPSHSPAPTPTLHSSPSFFTDFPSSLCVSSKYRSSPLEKNKTEDSSSSLSIAAVLTAPLVGPLDSEKHSHRVASGEPHCPPPAHEAQPVRGRGRRKNCDNATDLRSRAGELA